MKSDEHQHKFYEFRTHEDKSCFSIRQNNPDWQFQKVQSVYENNQDQPNDQYHEIISSQKIAKKLQKQRDSCFDSKRIIDYSKNTFYQRPDQSKKIAAQNQTHNKNPSSKTNSETNIVSQSQSLEYLSSEQPSFTNKGEFTVCEDFNIDMISPVKVQRLNSQISNVKQDWHLASFSAQNRKPLTLKQKCMKLCELVQELKFMKEGLQSRLKQQKINFTNQIQELKKVFFKVNIKYEKQMLEFTQKQSRPMSRQSSIRQAAIKNESTLQNELDSLKMYCKKLEQEKTISQQKYQSTLKKYQEQIELISEEFEKKLALERSSHFPSFPQQQPQCINCAKHQNRKEEKQNLESYEVQIWKNHLRQEEQNHSRAMKQLEEKVLMLQEEFEILQKSKSQSEKTLKEKKKEIVYREAEIEYKLKDIQRRQRDLNMAQSLIEKQREQLERKKDKIADYELKVLKEERRQKKEQKDKEILTSEYFSNCDKRKILSKDNLHGDRSDSLSSKGSRIDINARLKEIQMMRNRGSRNYDQNVSSRNSSKDSRSSGYKDYGISRVTLSGRNLKDYGITPSAIPTKEYNRANSQTIKLSQKLNRLTQTLQKQLRDID